MAVLEKQFRANDEEMQGTLKKWFNPNSVNELGDTDFMHFTESIYRERKNLVLALNDIGSVTLALESFLNFVAFFLMFFIVLMVFSQGSLAPVTITMATLFVSFSFLVSDTARAIATSFVFVFVRYPFDIGDRITIDTTGMFMFVQKINLLSTTVRWQASTVFPDNLFTCLFLHIFISSVSGTGES
jgi:hypothetical protein